MLDEVCVVYTVCTECSEEIGGRGGERYYVHAQNLCLHDVKVILIVGTNFGVFI